MNDILNILMNLYDYLLYGAVIISIIQFRKVDLASKFICISIVLAIISELLANYFAIKYRNNYPIYNIFGILDLICIIMYTRYITPSKKAGKFANGLIIFCLSIWIINTIFFQALDTLQNNFIIMQSLVILCLGLYAIYKRLTILDNNTLPMTHLFIPFVFILNQTGSLVSWIFYEYFVNVLPNNIIPLSICLVINGCLYYLGIIIILVFSNRINKRKLSIMTLR